MERLPNEFTTNILCLSKDLDPKGFSLYYLKDNEEATTKTPNKPFKLYDYLFLGPNMCIHLDPMILGSCHGFLCVAQGTNTPIPPGGCRMFTDVFFPFLNPISVFNPITGEYSPLPNFTIPNCDSDSLPQAETGKFYYKCFPGFGFEYWKKEFKMVLVMFSARNYKYQIFNNEVQICTLGSNTWRTKVGIAPNVLSQASNASSAAFLNGCLHWFVSDETQQNDKSVIVSFNLGLEEFGFIPTPLELHKIPYGFCRTFGVLDECLSLVECCRNFLINVWVMQKYNVHESWVKRFTIMLNAPFYVSDLGFKAVDIVKVRRNGEVVLLCDDKYMASYNITSKEWRVIEVKGFEGRGKDFVGSLEAHPFVGFSISLKSACVASIERLLPELITNILSRLPFKSTAQCKRVSKSWLTILSNPTFSWVQLTNFSNIDTDILALSVEPRIGGSTMYYLEETAIHETPCKPFRHLDGMFLQSLCAFLDPRILGSCHGFVCVAQGTNTPIPTGGVRMFTDVHFPFLPWTSVSNPITKEYSRLPRYTIPDCDACQKEVGKFFFKCFPGLGFDDSKKEFKMVLVIFSVRNYKSQIFNNEVQICTLGSNAWRKKIGIAPCVLVQANDASPGAFLNGCLHWIVTQNEKSLIVSFDLGVEEFGFVPAPPLQKVKDGHCTRFGVLDGCLSVVEFCRDYGINVWLMLKYDVKESWVKRFCLPLDSFRTNNLSFNVAEVLKICKNGELVLLCDDKYMVSYDLTSQNCRVLEVQGYEGRGKDYDGNLLAIPFAGSVISLKSVSGTGGGTREI